MLDCVYAVLCLRSYTECDHPIGYLLIAQILSREEFVMYVDKHQVFMAPLARMQERVSHVHPLVHLPFLRYPHSCNRFGTLCLESVTGETWKRSGRLATPSCTTLSTGHNSKPSASPLTTGSSSAAQANAALFRCGYRVFLCRVVWLALCVAAPPRHTELR